MDQIHCEMSQMKREAEADTSQTDVMEHLQGEMREQQVVDASHVSAEQPGEETKEQKVSKCEPNVHYGSSGS